LYGVGFADADGDGYGNFNAVVCFATEVPEGVSLNGTDCNDADASVYQILLEDKDLDGFGGVEVCAGKAATRGLVPINANYDNDCDDEDAAVKPGAMDFPGDGRDTNCDGVDGEIAPNLANGFDIDPYEYDLGVSSIGGACSAAQVPIEVTFGWRHTACLEVDGQVQSTLRRLRAVVRFQNTGSESTPASVFVGTSKVAVEWRMETPVPAPARRDATARYALGDIPPTVSFPFETGDGELCTELPFETQSVGYCLTEGRPPPHARAHASPRQGRR